MNTTKQKPENTVVTGTEKNPAQVAQAPAQTRTVVFTKEEQMRIQAECIKEAARRSNGHNPVSGSFFKGLKLH